MYSTSLGFQRALYVVELVGKPAGQQGAGGTGDNR